MAEAAGRERERRGQGESKARGSIGRPLINKQPARVISADPPAENLGAIAKPEMAQTDTVGQCQEEVDGN